MAQKSRHGSGKGVGGPSGGTTITPNHTAMTYPELRNLIREKQAVDFISASTELQEAVFRLDKGHILALMDDIGTIPEDIAHDSSEEKLYAKASDIVFARALQLMNFNVSVLKERTNCADIVAQSKYHGYSLVGDAKTFRMSRTAKNAKDFKVDSMDHWRGSADYAVLVCPYYQYPKKNSQIFKTALERNVALFSWEYLSALLSHAVAEDARTSLAALWDLSAAIAADTAVDSAEKNFIARQDKRFCLAANLDEAVFRQHLGAVAKATQRRGAAEMSYYEREVERIKKMNREEAIAELLNSKRLDAKIETIKKFISQLEK